MFFKKTVVGMGMALAMFTGTAPAQTPDVYLTVVDTFLYPGDPNGRYLTIRMNNPSPVKIGAYNVSLIIENPQAINFAYFDVDTILPSWRYFTDCSPPPCRPDSVLECPDTCYTYNSEVIIAGTVSQGADVIEGRGLSEIYLQVFCIYQIFGTPGPIIQPGDGILFQVPLDIFPIADTVPLSERQVQISIDPLLTYLVDSTGNITYRANDLHITNGTIFIPYSYPIKGDVNFDGLLNSTDVVRLMNYAFLGLNPPLPSESVGDVNCDNIVTGLDVVLLLNRVFLGLTDPPWCET